MYQSHKLISLLLLFSVLSSACTAAGTPYPSDPTGFFPAVTDPPGSFRPGGGGGGGAQKRGLSFDLVTDLSLEEIFQFYSAQLQAAGWVRLSESSSDDGISAYWEFLDENGKVWPVMLQVSRYTVSQRADYSIKMQAVNPP